MYIYMYSRRKAMARQTLYILGVNVEQQRRKKRSQRLEKSVQVWVCVCVCVYVCSCMCVFAFVPVHVCLGVHACVCLCLHVRVCVLQCNTKYARLTLYTRGKQLYWQIISFSFEILTLRARTEKLTHKYNSDTLHKQRKAYDRPHGWHFSAFDHVYCFKLRNPALAPESS